jgi:hypothetical protein
MLSLRQHLQESSSIMPTDDDEQPVTTPPTDFTSPKGGLYGGSFDSSDIEDPNVRSLLMDAGWVTNWAATRRQP